MTTQRQRTLAIRFLRRKLRSHYRNAIRDRILARRYHHARRYLLSPEARP